MSLKKWREGQSQSLKLKPILEQEIKKPLLTIQKINFKHYNYKYLIKNPLLFKGFFYSEMKKKRQNNGKVSCDYMITAWRWFPIYLCCFLVLLGGCTDSQGVNSVSKSQKNLDSLNSVLDDPEAKSFQKWKIYYDRISSDSLRNLANFRMSYHFYHAGDSLSFRSWNKKTLNLSKRRRDSSKIAESCWDLGNFFTKRGVADSAFFYYNKAFNLYKRVGNEYYAGKMLLNLAIIKKDIRDYTGSEISTVKAMNIFKNLGKEKQLYLSYNNLGVLYNELEEYERALYYHSKAWEYQEVLLEDNFFKETTINNRGVVYQNMGNFKEAQSLFEYALSNNDLYNENKRLYAMVMDNLAFAKLSQGDTVGLYSLFKNALEIRNTIDHQSGQVTSHFHLAEYYSKMGEVNKAIEELLIAQKIAKETNDSRDLLKILMLLSKLDSENSAKYLRYYINLNNKLQKKERAIRNKFARIEFETEEFIAQNRYLNEQRGWIIGGAVTVIIIALMILTIWRQKIQNRRLQLEREQQKSNEEIYNLLLDQQNKLEEGRNQEKERISRDLHDGILGKLFGTRLMLENCWTSSDISSKERVKNYLNDLRLIEKEVRNISHELSSEYLSEKGSYVDVLKNYLSEQEKIGNFKIFLKIDDQITWDKINSKTKINLFRILQEAVNNVIKYAEANELLVSMVRLRKEAIRVIIKDNGMGFEKKEKVKGIGLKNMKSRIKDLNGRIRIETGSEGTTIDLEVPVNIK